MRVAAMVVDASAVGVITAAIIGWLPPLAALVAIIWYIIQIFESRTIQKKIRVFRLRRLVRLRADAAALELTIRGQNFDLRGLDEANQIYVAATTEAAKVTRSALKEEQREIAGHTIEDALVILKAPELPPETKS